MERISTAEARRCLDELADRVDKTGERIILTRDGRVVAAIVHAEDACWLQDREDRQDLEDARVARTEAKEKGTIPWEQVKAELGN